MTMLSWLKTTMRHPPTNARRNDNDEQTPADTKPGRMDDTRALGVDSKPIEDNNNTAADTTLANIAQDQNNTEIK